MRVTSILIQLIFSQAITHLFATEVTIATTNIAETSSKLKNEKNPNEPIKPQYNTIGQLSAETIFMKAVPAPTSSPTFTAEYELPTKLKFDWKINDTVYLTLLNNEVAKGVVTYVDTSLTTNNQAFINGDIVTSKPCKGKNFKILGSFNAAFVVDSIAASITLIDDPEFLYELQPAVVNKSKSPLKKTYTVTKKSFSSFPPDGEPEPIPPMVFSLSVKNVSPAAPIMKTASTATGLTTTAADAVKLVTSFRQQ